MFHTPITNKSNGLRASVSVKVTAYDAQYITVKYAGITAGQARRRGNCGDKDSYVSLRTSVDAVLGGCGGAAPVSVRSKVSR